MSEQTSLNASPMAGEVCVHCRHSIVENIRERSWYHADSGDIRCAAAPEIADLERAVVEAAVDFRRDFAWSGQFANSDAIKVYNSLMESLDALIAAREKVQNGDPVQGV